MKNECNVEYPNVNEPKPIMSVPDGASYGCISTRKMWELIWRGEIKAVRIGGRVLLRRVDIDEYYKSHIV
tara:strand:- start:1639 stop:1848 length:210 start_codon:yes stop_codon:yes gene_type:complete